MHQTDDWPDDKNIEELAAGIDQSVRKALYAAGMIDRDLAETNFSSYIADNLRQWFSAKNDKNFSSEGAPAASESPTFLNIDIAPHERIGKLMIHTMDTLPDDLPHNEHRLFRLHGANIWCLIRPLNITLFVLPDKP